MRRRGWKKKKRDAAFSGCVYMRDLTVPGLLRLAIYVYIRDPLCARGKKGLLLLPQANQNLEYAALLWEGILIYFNTNGAHMSGGCHHECLLEFFMRGNLFFKIRDTRI